MENPKLKQLHDEWIEEATIMDMQKKMEQGELTSKELTLIYLNRISEFDQGKINSVLQINPDALHIAEAFDAERKEKGPRSALHGIPILIKANIDTADKMHTSAGSLALKDSIAQRDSFVAEQLRKAGAVILGKTNMTEWANFMAENMPSGYSSLGGQVLNPYGPGKFDVGGSSAGSGAAIAANFAAAAVGTETSGSILEPACQNSIVGIKPTVGLVSRRGIIPIAHSRDTAGPMARTVEDAAILLNALTGIDVGDPITRTNPLSGADFLKGLNKEGLKGKRIGVARDGFMDYLSDDKKQVFEEAIGILKTTGVELIEDITIPSVKAPWSYDVLTYEFKADLNAYLNTLHPSVTVRSLAQLIEFNQKYEEKMLKYGQAVLLESEATSGSLTESAYVKSLEYDIYHAGELGIDFAIKESNLDAILFPGEEASHISAKAGYPSVAVPAGYTNEGETFGVTFSAVSYTEQQLINSPYAFEQAAMKRKKPSLCME